ncbi:protein FAM178B [Pogoniulus pusillus]|uniref:protein FAM178B n=1 Tax=Pogoniulus pusillus TaxID=488313 RepID=UPI0030B98DBF
MAPHPGALRWFQLPLSSARVVRSALFSRSFQAELQRYRRLRAERRLRERCPTAPPPPAPASPAPAPLRPRGTARERAARCPKVPHSSRRSRGQQPPGSARPRAKRKEVPSQGSAQCQAALEGPRHIPAVAAGTSGGDTSGGQSSTARTVPQQAGRSCEGHQVGTARAGVCVPDSEEEEEELIPLRDLLAGAEPPSPAGHQQAACPRRDPLANSLDSLLQEKREQSQADRLQARLAWEQDDTGSASESEDEDIHLPEEHREFLARFPLQSSSIPTLHPGEPIFYAHPVPLPTLDANGLQPQSSLERLFLRLSPSCQTALVHAGALSLLYRSVPTCPVPVLRWLFQLLALCPTPSATSRALWDAWLGTEGEKPWCPTVQEITQAVTHLGANLSPLLQQRLLPPELCPANARGLEPSCFPRQASSDASSTLALVAQLGDICKFLALCVVTQPCCYSDGARLALLILFSFLSLARALRCHPLPELQHLLQCLLEGIRDWQKQLPVLCQALCQLSQHHHNLVALVQLLPDLTSRGRELRQHLSLHAMARLLGEPPGTVPPPGAQAKLEVLSRLLALAQPDALRQLALARGLEQPQDTEWEICYFSYSLLLLASTVVGTEQPTAEQQGALQQLCARLERHFRCRQLRGARLCDAQLDSLATLLFFRWHKMLA